MTKTTEDEAKKAMDAFRKAKGELIGEIPEEAYITIRAQGWDEFLAAGIPPERLRIAAPDDEWFEFKDRGTLHLYDPDNPPTAIRLNED